MKKSLLIAGIIVILLAGAITFLWLSSETPAPTDLGVENSTNQQTFSPFGALIDLFSGNNSETPLQNTEATSTNSSRSVYDLLSVAHAYQVTEEPVAAAQFFTMGTTTGDVLRYIERETGHIYQLTLSSGDTQRLSNTTVPRIQEAFFGNNGSLVALRYLGDDNESIETFVGALSTTTQNVTGELVGEFLSKNIQTIALHPTEPGAFYTLKAGGGAVGRLYDPVSHQTAPLFSSPLSEWKALWSGPSRLLLHTKPSSITSGFAYTVDPATGNQSILLNNISGLTALPNPSGSKILVGSSKEDFRLSLFDPKTDTTSAIIGATLPEKCTWVNETVLICAIPTLSSSIDAWYEGTVSFTDSVWRIDTATNLTDFLFDETVTGGPFDATYLSVNSAGTVLSFINKKDSHLWVASLLENSTF